MSRHAKSNRQPRRQPQERHPQFRPPAPRINRPVQHRRLPAQYRRS